MQSAEFSQTIFKKMHDGIEYRGIIIRQRFYPIYECNLTPGTQIQCRRVEMELEFKNPINGGWYRVNQSASFPI